MGAAAAGPGRDAARPDDGGSGDTQWDVFLSYARTDRDAVEPLIDALRAEGLRVFVDDPEVPAFTSISEQISAALAASRLLVAYFSRSYLTRLACRWELDHAIRAGYGHGNPFARIAVVNPEPAMAHIPYLELRSTKVWPEPDTDGERRQLARQVAAQLATLAGPIGELTSSRRFPSPPGFCGRDLELHEINALIGSSAGARADAMGRSPRSRTAFLLGTAGIGKSTLIAEYLHRFGDQFREVHRTTRGAPDHHPDGLAVLEDLRDADVPAVREWLAAMPATCAAILASREHLHLAADPVPLSGLDDASATALLTSYRSPATGEDRDVARLVAAAGGHPQTVHVLGHLLQTLGDRPYAAAMYEWHRLDGDAFAAFASAMGALQDGYPADPTPAITAAFPPEGSAARTALRALAARPGLIAYPEVLGEVLAAGRHPERTRSVLEELRRRGLLGAEPEGTGGGAHRGRAEAGRWERETDGYSAGERLAPLVARVAERHDDNPVARTEVMAAVDAAYDRHLHTGRRMGRTMGKPSDKSIEVAIELQVELTTRIATQSLPAGQGLLSEALGSLKAVFDAARQALKQLSAPGQNDEVALLAGKLCDTLRPFLTEWHPRLQDHHSTRPAGVGVLTHELDWDQAETLRSELPGLQASLAEILERLRELTGSDI